MVRVLLALMVGLMLTGTTGCRSLTGRSAGQWVDDHAITAKVKTRLAGLHPKTLTRINVDTYDGTVYLSGVVDSEQLKRRAEAIARDVERVHQVVTNLQLRDGGDRFAASPVTEPAWPVAAMSPNSLRTELPGLARVESGSANSTHGPFGAYDLAGRHVATVYTISMRELARGGLDDVRAEKGRPIDHVSIYAVPAHPDIPDGHYHVVLWHVPPAEAAALR